MLPSALFTNILTGLWYKNSGLQPKRLRYYLRRSSQRNPKKTGKAKTKYLKPLTSKTIANVKQSPISSQTNVKYHAKDLFISVPVTQSIIFGFLLEREIISHAERKQ